MVKKAESKEASESRWRRERLSMRVHKDLKDALEFLAYADRRSVSQYVEALLVDHVRALLKNSFEPSGELTPTARLGRFVLRDPRRRG